MTKNVWFKIWIFSIKSYYYLIEEFCVEYSKDKKKNSKLNKLFKKSYAKAIKGVKLYIYLYSFIVI